MTLLKKARNLKVHLPDIALGMFASAGVGALNFDDGFPFPRGPSGFIVPPSLGIIQAGKNCLISSQSNLATSRTIGEPKLDRRQQRLCHFTPQPPSVSSTAYSRDVSTAAQMTPIPCLLRCSHTRPLQPSPLRGCCPGGFRRTPAVGAVSTAALRRLPDFRSTRETTTSCPRMGAVPA